MEDFLDEKKLLESIGVGVPVNNEEELLQGITAALKDPEMLACKGQAGRTLWPPIAGQPGNMRFNSEKRWDIRFYFSPATLRHLSDWPAPA